MPTNRTRRTRSIKKSMIDPSIILFLLHGEVKKGTAAWTLYLSRFFDECQEIKRTWREHKKELLKSWIRDFPGTRPWMWWRYDAPPKPVSGWENERFNSPQRRRLGGIGTPLHEVSCVWSGFDKGIPSGWVTEDYKKAGFKGQAIDPQHPPRYESAAAFLKRLDLLTGPEKTYLKKHPELMEPEKIEFDENDE